MEIKNRVPSVPETSPNIPQKEESSKNAKNFFFLAACVLGIYTSFLTWAVLQERISTTPYGADMRVFRASNAVSFVQSSLAFLTGYLFLRYNVIRSGKRDSSLIPRNRDLLRSYAIVALCQSLSGPLSYSSLRHVDYITVLLAKSCKLVPVMLVHLILHRTKFPTYKYVVVTLVTTGVSLFSIYQPSKSAKAATALNTTDQAWGFLLLASSLFLDGLYNTTQDRMFHKYRGTGDVSGPHMMVILNSLTALFALVGVFVSGQWSDVVWFLRHHPQVFKDLVLYGLCGAVGQIFIFLTLEKFGSLVLVTTTVTRKMISMLLSVVMFNHKLSDMQWVGVALVFLGVTGEVVYKQLKR